MSSLNHLIYFSEPSWGWLTSYKIALKDYCKRDFLYLTLIFYLICETSSSAWSSALFEVCLVFFNSTLFPSPFLSPSPPFITLTRYFEVISSNRKNSMFLRAKDPAMAQSWYNAIQAAAASLLPQVKEEMKGMQPGMDVKHLGWLTEQVWMDTNVPGKHSLNHFSLFKLFF